MQRWLCGQGQEKGRSRWGWWAGPWLWGEAGGEQGHTERRGRQGAAGCRAGGRTCGAGAGQLAGRAAVVGAPCSYPFQHFIQVVSELHKQVDLPAGVAIYRVDLGKGRETPDVRQTSSLWGVGSPEGLGRGEGRTSPARPHRAQEGVSSPSQGPQLPWGYQPVG